MREDSYFYYWICDFGHFYEVRKSSLSRMEAFQKYFYRPKIVREPCKQRTACTSYPLLTCSEFVWSPLSYNSAQWKFPSGSGRCSRPNCHNRRFNCLPIWNNNKTILCFTSGLKPHLINNPRWTDSAIHGQTIGPIYFTEVSIRINMGMEAVRGQKPPSEAKKGMKESIY